jgi:hypothetical protein
MIRHATRTEFVPTRSRPRWSGSAIRSDGDDLPLHNPDSEDYSRLPAWSPHEADGSIDERRLGYPGTAREGFGHGCRAADLLHGAHLHGRAVGPEHDIRVKQREERAQVAAARGGQEGVDHFPLASDVGIPDRGRSLDPSPDAACELSCRRRGPPHTARRCPRFSSKRAASHSCSSIGHIPRHRFHHASPPVPRSCPLGSVRGQGSGKTRPLP